MVKMMTQQTPSLVQNRYIFSQLGMQLWAGRSTQVQAVDFATVHNLPISQLSSHLATPNDTPITVLQSEALVKPDIVRQPTALNADKMSDLASQDTKIDSSSSALQENQPSISYQLSAVLYRNWLLLVDEHQLEMATKSVWSSLMQALEKNAKQHQYRHQIRQLSYPFDEIYGQPLLAQRSLDGFVFGLTKGDSSIQVLTLTQMHDAIETDAAWLSQFSLADMSVAGEQKKQFWQFLHQ